MKAVLFALLMLVPGAAWADDFPMAALQSYATFRAELIKAGWKPILENTNTDDPYAGLSKYNEMTCNLSDLCWAKWEPPSPWRGDKRITFTVWHDADFRVAPINDPIN